MDDLEQLAEEMKELRKELSELKSNVRNLNDTMVGIAGLGSDELVGAIQNLQEEIKKLRERMAK